jgi:hypothetical protein
VLEARERRALVRRLEDPVAWPDAAAAILARLGFVLLAPSPGRDDSHLLVALRDRPSLEHFDPELIAFYAPERAGAKLQAIDRRVVAFPGRPETRRALWGHVHVVDRVPVENRFLGFGGELRIAAASPGLTLVDLWSPGPIVRWGGHSQGSDPLAAAIGAFFGRLIVPVDFEPGIETLLAATPANVLYTAFLLDCAARSTRAARRGAEPMPLDGWLAGARARARRDVAGSFAAEDLLRVLQLP